MAAARICHWICQWGGLSYMILLVLQSATQAATSAIVEYGMPNEVDELRFSIKSTGYNRAFEAEIDEKNGIAR